MTTAGLKQGDLPEHRGQVHLQAAERRPGGMKPDEAALDQRLQAQPDGAHVSDDLVGRLLEGEEKHAIAALGGGLGKMGGDARFPGAWRSGEQHAAAPEEAPPAQHRVQARNSGRHPLPGNLVGQAERGDRKDAESILADEKRKLVGAVERSAIFHDPQVPRGDLVLDPMVQQDDAVGNVFLQPVARELFAPALGRDDGGHALVLEPAEQPAQLGAQNRLIGQACEQRLERVQDHALGPYGVDREVEAHEQPLQVVLAGLLYLAAFDIDVFERDFLPPDQSRQIEAEGGDVAFQLGARLLKGHENAGFVELHGAAHEEFHRQERLATARPAADKRGPPARQSAVRYLVKSMNARGALGETKGGGGRSLKTVFHLKHLTINDLENYSNWKTPAMGSFPPPTHTQQLERASTEPSSGRCGTAP